MNVNMKNPDAGGVEVFNKDPENNSNTENKGLAADRQVSPAARLEYLIAALRCARLRVQLLQNEIDEIGIALRCGMVSVDFAWSWIQSIGADGFIAVPPAQGGTDVDGQ